MEDLEYGTDIAFVSYRFRAHPHCFQLNCGARIAPTSGMQPKYLIPPWCHDRLHLCPHCRLKTFQILHRSGMECALCGLSPEAADQKTLSMYCTPPSFFQVVSNERAAP
jgi:hypothetical protein